MKINKSIILALFTLCAAAAMPAGAQGLRPAMGAWTDGAHISPYEWVLTPKNQCEPLFENIPTNADKDAGQYKYQSRYHRYQHQSEQPNWTYIAYLAVWEHKIRPQNTAENSRRVACALQTESARIMQLAAEAGENLAEHTAALLKDLQDQTMQQRAAAALGLRYLRMHMEWDANYCLQVLPMSRQLAALGAGEQLTLYEALEGDGRFITLEEADGVEARLQKQHALQKLLNLFNR